jgi:ParB family transcriptional regulator, chromosome partitioning protein
MKLDNGFDAMLESAGIEADGTGPASRAIATIEIAAGALMPGRYQPRRHLSEESLAELADSIREQGILQPLVVRPVGNPGAAEPRYEIVAGERRWQAAKLAGLSTVPVIVRELDDQSALAVALIENLQREDLNPIDQAHSLKRLADEFELTHEQVAKAVGRSRASVSNLMRLLELDSQVKELLIERKIDMGHARALLPLDGQRQAAMARRAERRGLSVRQVEQAVRALLAAPPPQAPDKAGIDLQTRWLQLQLEKEVGEKISIRPSKDGYSLNIAFADLGQLQQALERLQELIGLVRQAAGPRARDATRESL